MALPTKEELESLETVRNGLPNARVSGNSAVVADGMHFIANGLPLFAISPSGGTPPVTYNASMFMIMF